jgi:hypothetical protein
MQTIPYFPLIGGFDFTPKIKQTGDVEIRLHQWISGIVPSIPMIRDKVLREKNHLDQTEALTDPGKMDSYIDGKNSTGASSSAHQLKRRLPGIL